MHDPIEQALKRCLIFVVLFEISFAIQLGVPCALATLKQILLPPLSLFDIAIIRIPFVIIPLCFEIWKTQVKSPKVNYTIDASFLLGTFAFGFCLAAVNLVGSSIAWLVVRN